MLMASIPRHLTYIQLRRKWFISRLAMRLTGWSLSVGGSGFPSAMSPLPDDHQQPLFLPTPTSVQASPSKTQAFRSRRPSDHSSDEETNNNRGLGREAAHRRTASSARNMKASSPALSVDFPTPQPMRMSLRSMALNHSGSDAFAPMSRNDFRSDRQRAPLFGAQIINTSNRVFRDNGGDAVPRKENSTNDVDTDFERKRKMLRAAGVIDASSPPPATGLDSVLRRASRPSLASASVRTPRYSTSALQKHRISGIFSPASFGQVSPAVAAAARASLRNTSSARPSGAGLNTGAIPMTVAPDIELHLRKKCREYGFKYEEAADQYFKEAGDLGRTILWMKNRVEAMRILIEDEEDRLELEEADERSGDHDDNSADGTRGEVKSDVKRNVMAISDIGQNDQGEEHEEDRQEIIRPDFPPPRSEARAYQRRQIRLSLLS